MHNGVYRNYAEMLQPRWRAGAQDALLESQALRMTNRPIVRNSEFHLCRVAVNTVPAPTLFLNCHRPMIPRTIRLGKRSGAIGGAP